MVFLIITTIILYLFLVISESREVPESLSATYYLMKDNGWMFQALMVFCGIGLLPSWMNVSSDDWRFLVFLSCAGIVFTGVAPAFKLKLEGAVHYSAAVVCCVSAILWQMLEGLWDITLLFTWIGGMLTLQWKKQWCWWLELSVIGSVFANLFRLILN